MLDLRLATATDIPALHRLIERAYRGESARAGWTHEADLLRGPRTNAAELAALIADPTQDFLLATEGAGTIIVACIAVSDRGGGRFYFGQLAVEPARQAEGLGRRMIAAAEDHARARGGQTMELTVIDDRRPELVAYYERRGYAATGDRRPFPYELPISGPPLALFVMTRSL